MNVAFLAALLASPGCGQESTRSGRVGEPAIAGSLSSACEGGSLPSGHHRGLRIRQGHQRRVFDLHVPQRATESASPVLFVLHPLTQSKEWGKLAAGMIDKSEAEGFIVVFPDGTLGSWNGGTCCGAATGVQVDDVTFLRAVHARVRELVCMDEGRVYATGLSNGAFMSHRLACEAADIFTAVAPVAGVLGIPQADCRPSRPVPVLQIHGTDDILVPFGGGLLGQSARETVAGWARRDGCTGSPVETFRRGAASCDSYLSCADGAEVSLCTIDGGGHCWFGEPICFVGHNPRDLPATDAVWDFLRRFEM